ncbi:Hypothetical protein, putative [Bodo saltans]|uniref:Uncharacterized protein n=1 Tax=Bodo saltans TaxID=75058 RepID=A0A0S4JCJ7_BODSA|nr:Hypothetical protein, putative [Bodo saltans]|eukprot:CUG88101.1 Hypothetical protein, putative [Bodo saltans]
MQCENCLQAIDQGELHDDCITVTLAGNFYREELLKYVDAQTTPGVTISDAYASFYDDDDDSYRDDHLRIALSGLACCGPPIVVTQTSAHQFPRPRLKSSWADFFLEDVATRVLLRAKEDVEEEDDEDDDLHYYSDNIPFGSKLLAAMMREVTSPDHSLALFVALAVPSDTPHFRLEQELWVPYEDLLFAPTNYDDNSTDASHTAPHSVMVTTLQAELDKIPFQSGFVNESLKSRSFLWRRREDYILAILHNALLSLISSKVVTLPPASESDVCEWLPRLVSCVATEIARQHKNPVAVVQAACTAVTNCRLAAFAATSIARAVPSAQRHQQVWAECVPCGRYWPVDVFVTHGSEVRCKMCFDKKALHFLASSKAEKRPIIGERWRIKLFLVVQ